MKYLFTCSYTKGISGVWTRVQSDAKKLIEGGDEVYVFSSNRESGSGKKVEKYEEINGIKCFRFPVKSFGSDNAFIYPSKQLRAKFQEINPDYCVCNTYRHHEGHIILKECVKKGIPCDLVTHAPFNRERNILSACLVWFYDTFFGKNDLKNFNRIITIAKWELPYLKKLGANEDKIVCIQNTVSSKYRKIDTEKYSKPTVLFLGRVTPVKDVETLAEAFNSLSIGTQLLINLRVVGPVSDDYKKKLTDIYPLIEFDEPIFDEDKKIEEYNRAHIFVLPSKQEGYPISLVEAKMCEMFIIASDIPANKEILEGYDKGFLFKKHDFVDLANKIMEVIKLIK